MKKYCPNCDEQVETRIELRHEIYPVKELSIEIDAEVRVCESCGHSISDTELDDRSLVQAFNKYRAIRNLLSPEEIRSIRNMYALSQRDFARALGFGEKTITRYENGSLQDEAQNNLILLMKKRSNFEILLEKADIPEDKKIEIRKRVVDEPRDALSQFIASPVSIETLWENPKDEDITIELPFHQFGKVVPLTKKAS